ncbi:condensation domain-containing protein [Streptomyces sp. NPDC001272]|uniref:condensation domain-containing protein n=1 Tax=unclassified Streptomyces TaxID=2593676 RepID=UPI0033AEC15B
MGANPGRLEPVDREGRIPVTANQEERLRADGARKFLVMGNLRCSGELNIAALEAALVRLLSRHRYLGAVFGHDSTGYYCTTQRVPHIPLRRIRVPDDVPDSRRYESGLELVSEVANEPFTVLGEPLFRAALIELTSTDHLLSITMDHVLADGLSRDIVVEELIRCYRQEAGHEGGGLPDSPFGFPEYATWLMNYLRAPAGAAAVKEWTDRLAGVGPIPHSRLVDPDASGGEPHGASLSISVKGDAKARLEAALMSERLTMGTLSAAALKVAVAGMRREQGDSDPGDVAIMASAENRVMREIRGAVGYFATPITLRTNLSDNLTVLESLKSVQMTSFHALKHQEIPHSLLVQEMTPDLYGVRHAADLDAAPPYVNFDHARIGAARTEKAGDLLISPFSLPNPSISIPRGGIRVQSLETAEEFTFELFYRGDRYGSPWIKRLLARAGRFIDLAAQGDFEAPAIS